jgi:hypothetical protein
LASTSHHFYSIVSASHLLLPPRPGLYGATSGRSKRLPVVWQEGTLRVRLPGRQGVPRPGVGFPHTWRVFSAFSWSEAARLPVHAFPRLSDRSNRRRGL